MYRAHDSLIVSATDLVGHLACGHLTSLELEAAGGGPPRPQREDPELDVLARRGLEHEKAHLETLRREGVQVVEVPEEGSLGGRARATLQAMGAGAEVVFQATFLDDREEVHWRAHADFLRKVPRPSRLGDHSYEPVDTKLARALRPSAVLQLCHYAEQVERVQGVAPERVHVLLGGRETVTLPLVEVSAYYRAARARFLEALRERPESYPLPVAHCRVCRWIERCRARWEADDHLSRVAGLGRDQARKLEAAGVSTLAALAGAGDDLAVSGVSDGVLVRLRRQARLQAARGPGDPPPVELLLPPEDDRGLAILPEPSPGDLFYDIEGDPHVGEHGIEYLHGMGWIDESGIFRFRAFWAHTPGEERRAFEAVIDFIRERRARNPDLHVYHYAPYETAALGRLMGRHGTREEELDDLLREEVFVDLYRVVRQGVAVGAPSYSLKELEPLYMGERTGEVTDASSSIVEYERWLHTGEDEILEDLEAYNRDDVESTWRLREWLEERRREAARAGHPVPRPRPRSEEDREEEPPEPTETTLLYDRLLEGAREGDPGWLMAHLLQWHRREAKPGWWRYFERILHADEDDLLADTEAIAGLEPEGEPVADKRSLIWTYRFDADQEYKLGLGDQPLDPETERRRYHGEARSPRPGTIVELDAGRGLLRLRRGRSSGAPHPRALIPGGPLPTGSQRASLRRVAAALLEHGVPGAGEALAPAPGPFAAARGLLAGLPPRVGGVGPGEPLRGAGEGTLDAGIRLARGLDRSVLSIQGPPGSGKTYTAARIITALVRDGRRVGITGMSHAVITNLLEAVLEAAGEVGVELRAIQKTGAGRERVVHPRVRTTGSNEGVESALASGEVDVVAGTAWLLSREEMMGAVDTLVVDEAGQLSLADVVAVSPAARNLILVGDPQQLAQPSTGTHPQGAGASGLEHVLRGRATVPPDRGLFLDRTWRMHPDVCAFVSEQVYDGRLASKEGRERQRVHDGPVVGGSGLRWLPVDHEGNATSAEEEADAVAGVHGALLGRRWTDHDGIEAELGPADILVVAPYNAQVNLVRSRLQAGARVGTVDRFQGREAPVVLVSLTASSAEDVPRGMEFLYSRNRLNVAVSRAQALAVVAGSPALLSVRCRSVAQMRLANVLCRLVEMAVPVDPGR